MMDWSLYRSEWSVDGSSCGEVLFEMKYGNNLLCKICSPLRIDRCGFSELVMVARCQTTAWA